MQKLRWIRLILLSLVGFALACGGQSLEEGAVVELVPLRGKMPLVGADLTEWYEFSATSEPMLVTDKQASLRAAGQAYARLIEDARNKLGSPYTTILETPTHQAGGQVAMLQLKYPGVFRPVNEEAVLKPGEGGKLFVTAQVTVWIRKPEFFPTDEGTSEGDC